MGVVQVARHDQDSEYECKVPASAEPVNKDDAYCAEYEIESEGLQCFFDRLFITIHPRHP